MIVELVIIIYIVMALFTAYIFVSDYKNNDLTEMQVFALSILGFITFPYLVIKEFVKGIKKI